MTFVTKQGVTQEMCSSQQQMQQGPVTISAVSNTEYCLLSAGSNKQTVPFLSFLSITYFYTFDIWIFSQHLNN